MESAQQSPLLFGEQFAQPRLDQRTSPRPHRAIRAINAKHMQSPRARVIDQSVDELLANRLNPCVDRAGFDRDGSRQALQRPDATLEHVASGSIRGQFADNPTGRDFSVS